MTSQTRSPASVEYLSPADMRALLADPAEAQRVGKAMARRLAALYAAGDLTGDRLRRAVATTWWQSVFPLSWVPAATWRRMFADAGYTVDGRRTERPTGRLELFRGVAVSRTARRLATKHTGLPVELGWSWTVDLGEAVRFAKSHARGSLAGAWRVYRIDAPPAALLAEIPINAEHVVDTSRLDAPPETVPVRH